MSSDFYKQVKVQKNVHIMYVWIPEKYAKQGKVIKLKVDDIWEDGWKVIQVYHDIVKNYDEVIIDSNQYKHHREMTDI